MARSDNSLSDVTKLSGCENYDIWKFRMRQLFQKEDLWELVQPPTIIVHPVAAEGPGEVEVAAPAATGTPVASTAPAVDAAATALSLVKRRNRVLGIICLSIKDEVVPNIAECWVKL
jgi:hypothetical protein